MKQTPRGSIQITDAALASLIGLTAHEVPGVVGMAPINLKEGITKALGRSQVKDGVSLHRGDRDRAKPRKDRSSPAKAPATAPAKVQDAAPASAGAASAASSGPVWAELSIIVAYGVSIPTVAQNIEDRVRHIVRTHAGVELSEVHVNVVGVSRE